MNSDGIEGKRFIFAITAMICMSAVVCYRGFSDAVFVQLFGILTAAYVSGQSWSDVQEARAQNGAAKPPAVPPAK